MQRSKRPAKCPFSYTDLTPIRAIKGWGVLSTKKITLSAEYRKSDLTITALLLLCSFHSKLSYQFQLPALKVFSVSAKANKQKTSAGATYKCVTVSELEIKLRLKDELKALMTILRVNCAAPTCTRLLSPLLPGLQEGDQGFPGHREKLPPALQDSRRERLQNSQSGFLLQHEIQHEVKQTLQTSQHRGGIPVEVFSSKGDFLPFTILMLIRKANSLKKKDQLTST